MRRTPFAHIIVLIAFLVNTIGAVPTAQAQEFALPAPGVMVHLSSPVNPAILKGIKVHTDNPFRFDFILDKGDTDPSDDKLKEESSKLIKYFLASLTIPEKDLWVNLSPYEKDCIVPESFGGTEMGRDLLAEDYMLKQITASLIYPEDEVGKKFWKRIYEEAQSKYHTTNILVNTFNKVWIVPEKAVVYENAKAGTAYVVESKLKVMLEEDYLSMSKHAEGGVAEGGASPVARNEVRTNGETRGQDPDINRLGSQIVREIVIPELTKEINEGQNFSQLRQVYNSLILATWYKKKIKDSILSQVYADKNKTAGVNINNPQEKEKIYQQYLQAFKKGVYNYIKEDIDPATQQSIPRKYFSGGMLITPQIQTTDDFAMVSSPKSAVVVSSQFDAAMNAADGARGSNKGSPQLDLPIAVNTKLEFSDIEKAQEDVRKLSQKVNELYKFRESGAFTVQQFIPIGYRDQKAQELPADIHGGEALWLMFKDLFQSDVFKKYYPVNGLNPQGVWDRADVQVLVQEFFNHHWITEIEKQGLINSEERIFEFLTNFENHASYDIKGLKRLKYNDLGDNPEENYKKYYQETEFVYGILSRVFKQIMSETLPSFYAEAKQLSDGFELKELKQGFYIDLENQYHLKVKDDQEKDVRVIDFPQANIEEVFQKKPELLIKVFQLASEQDAIISDKVLNAVVSQTKALENKDLSSTMKEVFFKFFKANGKISLSLLKMYQVGLLGKFLPEFDTKLSYHFEAAFHRFSVAMHTIYLLYFLEYILPNNPELDQAYKAYTNILKSAVNGNLLATLRLSILCHDADKEEARAAWSKPHPIKAATGLAPRLLNQLAGASILLPAVEWLVWYHQEWGMRAANTKGRSFYFSDLIDSVELGKGILNQDLLNIFYLLTVADANSVEPSRRDYFDRGDYEITTNLFLELSKYLEKSNNLRGQEAIMDGWKQEAIREEEDIQKDAREFLKNVFTQRKSKVIEQLGQIDQVLLDDQNAVIPLLEQAIANPMQLLNFLKMFSSFYIRTLKDKDFLIRQFILFVLMHNETKNEVISRTLVSSVNTVHGPMFELLVGVNKDAPGVMYKITGVLAAAGFNILDAKINTTSQGVVFDKMHGYFLGFQNPTAIGKELLIKLEEINKSKQDQKITLLIVNLQEKLNKTDKSVNERLSWQDVLPILINLLIKEKITVDDVFNFNGTNRRFERLSSLQGSRTKVIFDNDVLLQGKGVSVFNLNTDDRNGLLYIVSRLLGQRFGLNIEVFPVNTLQRGVNDQIYVTSKGGVLSLKEKEEVKKFLEPFLDRDIIEQKDVIRVSTDLAMKTEDETIPSFGKGGIDLTSANMNLQTQNAGEGIKFKLDPAMLQQLQNAPGFLPVIINIQPMTDLRQFLGLKDEDKVLILT